MSAEPGTSQQNSSELLADRAYAALRDRIVALRIAPGAPINEDALGRELDMGRTPVREAIKRLALENLVTVFPRRGTFASEINITDLAHISDVRQQLEGHAAYRAAQRLTAAASRGARGAARPDRRVRRRRRATSRCASTPRSTASSTAATANPYLEETLARYFNLSLRIWYLVLDRLPHLSERVREHRALLEAIRDGEADRARAIAADHVGTFATEIRSVL